jgi:hypothetical protein
MCGARRRASPRREGAARALAASETAPARVWRHGTGAGTPDWGVDGRPEQSRRAGKLQHTRTRGRLAPLTMTLAVHSAARANGDERDPAFVADRLARAMQKIPPRSSAPRSHWRWTWSSMERRSASAWTTWCGAVEDSHPLSTLLEWTRARFRVWSTGARDGGR